MQVDVGTESQVQIRHAGGAGTVRDRYEGIRRPRYVAPSVSANPFFLTVMLRHSRPLRGLRIESLVAFALALALLIPTASEAQQDGEPDARPNILVILADDMGYGDVGAFNPDSKIPTPHLDRLAEQGRRFTDAHSPGWCACRRGTGC